VQPAVLNHWPRKPGDEVVLFNKERNGRLRVGLQVWAKKIFWVDNKAINEFGFRRIWRILQISEGVIHLALRCRWITPSLTCRILHIVLSLIQWLIIIFFSLSYLPSSQNSRSSRFSVKVRVPLSRSVRYLERVLPKTSITLTLLDETFTDLLKLTLLTVLYPFPPAFILRFVSFRYLFV